MYSPVPPVAAGTYWSVLQGNQYCQVTNGGACVTDGIGNHGASETCLIIATRQLYATATVFNTEDYCKCSRNRTRDPPAQLYERARELA